MWATVLVLLLRIPNYSRNPVRGTGPTRWSLVGNSGRTSYSSFPDPFPHSLPSLCRDGPRHRSRVRVYDPFTLSGCPVSVGLPQPESDSRRVSVTPHNLI